jgi:cation diffusion facilitator family transporter
MIRTPQQAALGSIAVGVAAFALKLGAWGATGSVAFYSDALESVVNIVAAVAAFVAVRVAALPADANHPYGHQKAEFLSATLEAALILIAAGLILWEALGAVMAPRAPDAPLAGAALVTAATALNAVWARLLLRWGRAWRSPALVADGRHLWADVVSSAGVLAGFALIPMTGWLWLDPALATGVAVNVLWSGWRMLRESVGGLMDEAVDDATLRRIARTVAASAQGAVQAHDLKARSLGRGVAVEFHLVVPGDMSVEEAHRICDRIEAALRAEFAGLSVAIHVEPEHKAKDAGAIPAAGAA